MPRSRYRHYLKRKYLREHPPGEKDEDTKLLIDIVLSNRQLHEEHLKAQDALLNIIKKQSKPQLWREMIANVLGNVVTDGGAYIIKKIIK